MPSIGDTLKQTLNDEIALFGHNRRGRRDTESRLKAVNKWLENMLINPCTDVLDSVPDAFQQTGHCEFAVFEGVFMPPINHAVPCVFDKAPQESSDTAEGSADAVKQCIRYACPVDISNECRHIVTELLPIDIFNCRAQSVQRADDTVRERLCRLYPVNGVPQSHEGVGKGFSECRPVYGGEKPAQSFNKDDELRTEDHAEVCPINAIDDVVNAGGKVCAEGVPVKRKNCRGKEGQGTIQVITDFVANTGPVNACNHAIELSSQRFSRCRPVSGLDLVGHELCPVREFYVGEASCGVAAASTASTAVRAVVAEDIQLVKCGELPFELISSFGCCAACAVDCLRSALSEHTEQLQECGNIRDRLCNEVDNARNDWPQQVSDARPTGGQRIGKLLIFGHIGTDRFP